MNEIHCRWGNWKFQSWFLKKTLKMSVVEKKHSDPAGHKIYTGANNYISVGVKILTRLKILKIDRTTARKK